MSGVLEEDLQHIRRFQLHRGGVAAGMTAEEFALHHLAVDGQGDAVGGIVHEGEDGGGAGLHAQQLLHILGGGNKEYRGRIFVDFPQQIHRGRILLRNLILTDEELAIYKSGRNSKSAHRSKSASAVEYRRATGLECLYGYFWLSAQYDRARELFLRGVE